MQILIGFSIVLLLLLSIDKAMRARQPTATSIADLVGRALFAIGIAAHSLALGYDTGLQAFRVQRDQYKQWHVEHSHCFEVQPSQAERKQAIHEGSVIRWREASEILPTK